MPIPSDRQPAPFARVLVANRGEIAVRVIRACRELGVEAVAVYGEGEQDAPHVRLADDAYRLPGSAGLPYLDVDAVVALAGRAGAAAVHPGYGFLSENPAFAAACAAAGLVFVGPDAETIRAMGDKVEARRIAAEAGVPIVPGSDGPVASVEEARAWAARRGYPVAVKAAAGGGGRGFRVAREEAGVADAFVGASGEAGRSFANPVVYLERYLERPRHVEVQLMADDHGAVVAVGERDCSVQRRHQKLIEEAPAPGVPEATRRALGEAAVALARRVGYRNAGTVEFLLAEDGRFYFLEMNTRIQVEHPVTEATTGIDLVKEQIVVAAGRPLSFGAADVAPRGHAIECRINAEDPGRGFAPAPGTIARYREPGGFGVRVDAAVAEGGAILPAYDSLIAKLMAWGRDRDEALARMRRALVDFKVEGVPTTIPFHCAVLDHPVFRAGGATTSFLVDHPEVVPATATAASAAPVRAATDGPAPDAVVAEVNGRRFEVRIHRRDAVAAERRRPPAAGEARRRAGGGSTPDGAELASPVQGTVVRVGVTVGQAVRRGETVCVVEAMKMENDVPAHRDGTVEAIKVAVGDPVRVGAVLAEIGPSGH